MIMPDGTRCDILTDTHAIEVDFADKWAKAIGQSLNYAMQTGKKTGIVLVLKDRGDESTWIDSGRWRYTTQWTLRFSRTECSKKSFTKNLKISKSSAE